MSESVLVSKEINVQVDYVRCSNCGNELDFKLESDGCGDLQIYVDKCECEDD